MATYDPNDLSNPEEESLKGVQSEISRLSGADTGGLRNRANVYDAAKSYGLNFDLDPGVQPYLERYGSAEGVIQAANNSDDESLKTWAGYLRSGGENEAAALSEQIRNRLGSLNQQATGLSSAARERRLGRLTAREAKLKEELGGVRSELDQAIDRQLSNVLEDFGYRAGVTRSQTGASFANRGLLKSDFADRRLGDVTLQELQQKAGARQTAATEHSTLDTGFEDINRKIEGRRRQAEQTQSLTELANLENQGFQFELENIQNSFSKRLLDAELDADSRAFTTGLIGKAIGGAFKLFSSVPPIIPI